MFSFDQIAVRTDDMNESIHAMAQLGHTEWVQDEVHAVHLYADPNYQLGGEFTVRLAFNYEAFPGLEYELIQSLSGRTCQLLLQSPRPVCHLGYHIQDHHPELRDSLKAELMRLQGLGLKIAQVSQTVGHTGTKRRYRYAFAYGSAFGCMLKIIQRMDTSHPSASVEAGQELYKWLS